MNIVEYTHEDNQFYPTPDYLVKKMVEGVNWGMIQTILEPSAGKGNILREISFIEKKEYQHFDVDCVELDKNLAQILKYNFSGERYSKINSRLRTLHDGRTYDRTLHDYVYATPDMMAEAKELEHESEAFFENGIHLVHDDFLTYSPFKKYDLIIMNPPFSDGDKHLLKALKIQQNGGTIICLLNAETIRNPHTMTRQELKKELRKYNASVEYIENAFLDSERRTAVEIALVKVFIPEAQPESDIYRNLVEAENYREYTDDEIRDLEVVDYIKALVNRFNLEVKAGLELIKQYRALKQYMLGEFELKLTDSSSRNGVKENNYLKEVRLKYWERLLANKKFTGKLTSKLQKEYREKVNTLANYDFSEYNIYALSAEMNAQVKTGIEDEIMAMFDRLTAEHSWYPETKNNRHYYDGWKTNIAHKIGKKVIIPCYGIYDSWDAKPRTYYAVDALEDIEKVLNYLDGGMTLEVDLQGTINAYFQQGITKKVPLKYFKATFYKKGTVHLEFTRPELIERFNIYAAQNKKWLPPNYGKATYQEMTDEEKVVVDNFQGEAAYNEVLKKSNYYLAAVSGGSKLLQLT